MNGKIGTVAFALALAPIASWAANVNFPGSGGDLASAADWGGTPAGADDYVTIPKSGTYTLSEDRTFQAVYMTASGTLALGGAWLTTTIGDGVRANNAVIFDGCKIDLSGTGVFNPVFAKSGIVSVVTNACIITNAATFYASNYASSSRTVVAGGSRIYAATLRVSDSRGVEDTLEIVDGSQVHIGNYIRYDTGVTTGTYGGSRIVVSGVGSLLHQKGGTASSPEYIWIGNYYSDNWFIVSDNAQAISDNGGVVMSIGGNKMIVEKGAQASLPYIRFASSGNLAMVSNATLSCNGAFSLAYTENETLHNSAGRSNNVFIAAGPNASVAIRGPDLFGTGHGNAILVEDGAQFTPLSELSGMMSQTCDGLFRISGQGTSVGSSSGAFNIGMGTSAISTGNVVSVESGATLLAYRIYLEGVANELAISNATVQLAGGSVALYVGSRDSGTTSTNNVVTFSGETPKLTVATDNRPCRFYGGSTLRFCIPRKGYVAGFVPFDVACGFEMDSLSTLVLDCEEWAARTGGTLHLIHSKSFMDNVDAKGTTVARLKATALPPDCTLTVSGGNVYLKCPIRKGTTVILR